MAAVVVVIVPFYAAFIVTLQAIEMSSSGGIVIMPLASLRQIRYGEIIVVAAFNLVREAMLHGGIGLLDVVG